MIFMQRPDISGFVTRAHRRRGEIELILIHRNTVSELWKREHPKDIGDDAALTFRWYAHPERRAAQERKEFKTRLFPYHFFLDDAGPDCIVNQAHSCDVRAPHASHDNERAVGVCLNIDGRTQQPSQAMAESAVWTCANLLKAYPDAKIKGHNDAKRCPGECVDVDGIALRAREWARAFDSVDPRIMLEREW